MGAGDGNGRSIPDHMHSTLHAGWLRRIGFPDPHKHQRGHEQTNEQVRSNDKTPGPMHGRHARQQRDE